MAGEVRRGNNRPVTHPAGGSGSCWREVGAVGEGRGRRMGPSPQAGGARKRNGGGRPPRRRGLSLPPPAPSNFVGAGLGSNRCADRHGAVPGFLTAGRQGAPQSHPHVASTGPTGRWVLTPRALSAGDVCIHMHPRAGGEWLAAVTEGGGGARMGRRPPRGAQLQCPVAPLPLSRPPGSSTAPAVGSAG